MPTLFHSESVWRNLKSILGPMNRRLRLRRPGVRNLDGVNIIISATNKAGLEEWIEPWRRGARLISVGGTLKKLRELGMSVTPIENFTGGQGECLDGLVKTLDTLVFKACLANLGKPEHVKDLGRDGLEPIDIVVMNQYDWNQGVKDGVTGAELIRRFFDVGGNCVPLAALKGGRVVVMDPADYPVVVNELCTTGKVSGSLRDVLFHKALAKIVEALTKIRDWSRDKIDQEQSLFT